MLPLRQRKVRQPVVHEVDAPLRIAKLPLAERELLRRENRGLYAEAAEQPLEEQELGIKELRLRRIVEDRNARRNAVAAGEPPFLHEHLDYGALEALARNRAAHEPGDILAAGPLRTAQQAV